jgi:flagellar export protein FliJ
MHKYRFRLETVKKLRVAHRDQQLAALADGYRAEQILAEQQAALADEAAGLRDLQRSALESPYTNVNQLVDAQRYDSLLQAQEKLFAEQSARLAVEVERRRLAAVEADRGVRVLEKLDERRRADHRRQQERSDNKQLDEVASARPKGLDTYTI